LQYLVAIYRLFEHTLDVLRYKITMLLQSHEKPIILI